MASIQLQRQYQLASERFKKWRLRVNELKTIAWSKTVKYLGVTIDHKLNFSIHSANIVKKTTCIRGSLHPVFNRKSAIPLRTRLDLLKMYIILILTYASSVRAQYKPSLSE